MGKSNEGDVKKIPKKSYIKMYIEEKAKKNEIINYDEINSNFVKCKFCNRLFHPQVFLNIKCIAVIILIEKRVIILKENGSADFVIYYLSIIRKEISMKVDAQKI